MKKMPRKNWRVAYVADTMVMIGRPSKRLAI